MGADIEVKGMDELVAKAQALGLKGKSIQNQALLAGAQPILNEAVQTTEFKDMTGRLRKDLKISRPKSKGNTRYVLVGIDKGDISEVFYGKFIEFGDSTQPSKPYLGPAYENHKAEAKQIIKAVLKEGLGL